jgi:hypothetical protein
VSSIDFFSLEFSLKYLLITILNGTTIFFCLIIVGLISFNARHTSEAIAIKLADCLNDFDISQKVVAITSDNASNMVKAIKEIGHVDHIRCAIHSLQLIVNKTIDKQVEINSFLKKVKEQIAFFHRSKLSAHTLTQYQQCDQVETLSVVKSVDTRWDSLFDCLDRWIKIWPQLKKALRFHERLDLIVDEVEYECIKKLVELLRPFYNATKALSSSKMLLSELSLIVFSLIAKYRNEYESFMLPWQRQFKLTVVTYLEEYTKKSFQADSWTMIAAAVDPRFKHFPFFDSGNAFLSTEQLSLLWFKVEAVAIKLRDQSLTNEVDGTRSSELQADINVATLIPVAPHLASVSFPAYTRQPTFAECDDIAAQVRQEILLYRASTPTYPVKLIDGNIKELPVIDPIAWWQAKGTVYPNVRRVFACMMSIQASSVESERVFSTSGRVFSDLRNRLDPSALNKTIFINRNNDQLRCDRQRKRTEMERRTMNGLPNSTNNSLAACPKSNSLAPREDQCGGASQTASSTLELSSSINISNQTTTDKDSKSSDSEYDEEECDLTFFDIAVE